MAELWSKVTISRWLVLDVGVQNLQNPTQRSPRAFLGALFAGASSLCLPLFFDCCRSFTKLAPLGINLACLQLAEVEACKIYNDAI